MSEILPDSEPVGFDDGEIPTETEARYRCEECGTPLEYAGRGRPPTRCDIHKKSGSSKSTPRTSNNATVEAAAQSLVGLYSLIAMPLTIFAPETAVQWAAKADQLDAQNRQILAANPKLAKQIAGAASGAGAPALIAVNAAYIGPTLLNAYREAMYRRAVRDSSE